MAVGQACSRIFRKDIFLAFALSSLLKRNMECEQQATLEEIVANGLKIQTYRWGDSTKPYVLMMHGWAGRATQFRKFIPELVAAGYQVVGFDGPAHGKSSGKRTTILEFETALKMVISRVG
jgi:alpha-beta hydrolase superfamily lysophospholipase